MPSLWDYILPKTPTAPPSSYEINPRNRDINLEPAPPPVRTLPPKPQPLPVTPQEAAYNEDPILSRLKGFGEGAEPRARQIYDLVTDAAPITGFVKSGDPTDLAFDALDLVAPGVGTAVGNIPPKFIKPLVNRRILEAEQLHQYSGEVIDAIRKANPENVAHLGGIEVLPADLMQMPGFSALYGEYRQPMYGTVEKRIKQLNDPNRHLDIDNYLEGKTGTMFEDRQPRINILQDLHLNPEKFPGVSEVKRTLTHEFQHLDQDVENLLKFKYMPYKLRPHEIEARAIERKLLGQPFDYNTEILNELARTAQNHSRAEIDKAIKELNRYTRHRTGSVIKPGNLVENPYKQYLESIGSNRNVDDVYENYTMVDSQLAKLRRRNAIRAKNTPERPIFDPTPRLVKSHR